MTLFVFTVTSVTPTVSVGATTGDVTIQNSSTIVTVAGAGVLIDGGPGPQGVQGYTGSLGYTGSIGYTGSQGIQGIQGDRGDLGYTGSRGTDGILGGIGYTGSRGGANPWIAVSTNITATAQNQYLVNTTAGPLTLTLPANPISGDYVYLSDGADWSVNNLTVARNGSLIEDQADNLLINVKGIEVFCVYNGSSWQISSTLGAVGPTGIPGEQGPQGPAGGYTGSQGQIGYTGSQGIQGDIGYTGSQGASGTQGDQGQIGYTGSRGDAGIQGSIGYVGSQGIQGIQGDTGNPFGGGTFTNTVTVKGIDETVYNWGNVSAGTYTLDASSGTVHKMTITGNVTINSLTNAVTGRNCSVIIIQDGTGSRTLTSSMKFAGGSKTLSTGANAIDIITIFYDGSQYLASLTKGFA